MQKIVPNLWFDKNVEEAVDFYVSIFPNSSKERKMLYDEAGARASGQKEGDVMTIDFKLAGQNFIAINGGPYFKFTLATSFSIACESVEEVEEFYKKLVDGGEILMALDKYPFADKYAWVNDKYGVSWQIISAKKEQKITPGLMFINQNHGRAKEAMDFYISVFKDGEIVSSYPYPPEAAEKDGALAHAEFKLFGQDFIAMDSGMEHKFDFTGGVSFMVNCKDQQEIDVYWNALSADPSAEQCGWLKDKYGLSWQIVPEEFQRMIVDEDKQKVARVMKAMLGMKKFDVEMLREASLGKTS